MDCLQNRFREKFGLLPEVKAQNAQPYTSLTGASLQAMAAPGVRMNPKLKKKDAKSTNVLIAGLMAGATSGVITKTGTAPFERVKILSQVFYDQKLSQKYPQKYPPTLTCTCVCMEHDDYIRRDSSHAECRTARGHPRTSLPWAWMPLKQRGSRRSGREITSTASGSYRSTH